MMFVPAVLGGESTERGIESAWLAHIHISA